MNEYIQEVDATNFTNHLNSQKKPCMIMFYNPTCSHCQIMDPIFEENAEDFKDEVTFMKFNILHNQQIPYLYGVQSTPTFIFFYQRQPITILSGAVHPTILRIAIQDGIVHGKHCASKRTPINYEFSGYL